MSTADESVRERAAPPPGAAESGARAEPGSYRDRSSRVFHAEGAVWRALSARGLENWRRLEASPLWAQLQRDGRVIGTTFEARPPAPPPFANADAGAQRDWAGCLRHERVPFVSYPYEWSFGMLRTAAELTLSILADALEHDLTLKDATPFNVQWIGARPVFIDVGSFEPLAPGQPWTGYRQFCELFLYPLFLQAYKRAPFQPWLRGNLEGIAAEEFRGLCSWRDLLRPGVFGHVVLQAALQRSLADSRRDVRRELADTGFKKELIAINVRKLRRILARLEWDPPRSTWSDYATTNTYDAAERERKAAFVRAAICGAGSAGSARGKLVLDLGCNTGEYARVASECQAAVVAMDADHLAIEHLWRALRAEPGAAILPLVVPLTSPSPGTGWRGRERRALFDRARPDATLALALLHHLVLGANVPLDEVVDWLSGLGGDLVIEYVSKSDPQAQRLLRNKDDVYGDYSEPALAAALERSYEIASREPLQGGQRVLFHARPRRGQDTRSP